MISASSAYDFGTDEALSNSLVLTRMGKDLQFSLGFTYNTLQNNFGVIVEMMPNLGAQVQRRQGRNGFGSTGLFGSR
jgi:hypothetical protein